MFIAGIEIFFGFVAGALLLGVIVAVFSGGVALLKGAFKMLTRIPHAPPDYEEYRRH